MIKKYIVARKAILAERDTHDAETQRSKYASNPNFIYEAFQNDTVAIQRLRDSGEF